jgi:hypothetical protein
LQPKLIAPTLSAVGENGHGREVQLKLIALEDNRDGNEAQHS